MSLQAFINGLALSLLLALVMHLAGATWCEMRLDFLVEHNLANSRYIDVNNIVLCLPVFTMCALFHEFEVKKAL